MRLEVNSDLQGCLSSVSLMVERDYLPDFWGLWERQAIGARPPISHWSQAHFGLSALPVFNFHKILPLSHQFLHQYCEFWLLLQTFIRCIACFTFPFRLFGQRVTKLAVQFTSAIEFTIFTDSTMWRILFVTMGQRKSIMAFGVSCFCF